MADSMPVLMAYYEQDGLRCAYANRAYAATFGHTPGSIVGRGLAEIVGAEALRQIEPHIERMFAQRQTVSYARNVVDAKGQIRGKMIGEIHVGSARDRELSELVETLLQETVGPKI
jgi:PAS domain S-box-containing protein